jgi:hypothetical protein
MTLLDIGFEFRATSGFIATKAGDVFASADAFPTTRSGSPNFGIQPFATLTAAADLDSTGIPELAGHITIGHNDGEICDFTVTLPNPMFANIYLAMGTKYMGYGALASCAVQIADNNTPLFAIEGLSGGGVFKDAQGTEWSAAQWPTNNVHRRVQFASTTFQAKLGMGHFFDGGRSVLAYVRIQEVIPGPATALVFTQQPKRGINNVALDVQPVVHAIESDGSTKDTFVDPVVFTRNVVTGAGALGGTTTVNAVAGITSPNDLKIAGGTGQFTLTATSGSISGTSAPFTVHAESTRAVINMG